MKTPLPLVATRLGASAAGAFLSRGCGLMRGGGGGLPGVTTAMGAMMANTSTGEPKEVAACGGGADAAPPGEPNGSRRRAADTARPGAPGLLCALFTLVDRSAEAGLRPRGEAGSMTAFETDCVNTGWPLRI